jgi:hypothetical protein
MTFRKIATVARPYVEVVVGYDAALREYRCRLIKEGKPYELADCFTNDKADAMGTANIMAQSAYDTVLKQRVRALLQDTLALASLKGIVIRVWQQIGYDSLQACAECGEEIDNETAIESCLDADRPLTFDSRESQALCKLAYEKYGFDAVRLALSKQVNLV